MENIVKYRVKITSPNHLVIHRGKRSRTPAEYFNVYEHELPLLKSQIHRLSLNATITEESDLEEDIVEDFPVDAENNDVRIEELYNKKVDKPVTIMDKLIAEEDESGE